MGTHPIFESDFDCLTECVIHDVRYTAGILPPPGGGGGGVPTTAPIATTQSAPIATITTAPAPSITAQQTQAPPQQQQGPNNGTANNIKTETDVELTPVHNNTRTPGAPFQQQQQRPPPQQPNNAPRPMATTIQSSQPRIGSGLDSGQNNQNVGDGRGTHPDELTPEEMTNVTKCRNFLITLIQLAQRNESTNPQTVQNVKDLVQQLIDDRIPAQLFTERLQTELQSTPQPYLVPFLRRSLPLLRRSMQQRPSGGAGGATGVSAGPTSGGGGVVAQKITPKLENNTSSVPLPTKRPAPSGPGTGGPIPHKQQPIKSEPTGPTQGQPVFASAPSQGGPNNPTIITRRPQPITPRNAPGGAPTIQIVNKPIPSNARLPVKPGVARIPGGVGVGPSSQRPMPGNIRYKPGPKAEPVDGGDGDETDLINMADVNLENEAKNLKRADVGTEVRNAPGGDEQIYVNKQVLHKLVGQAASRAGDIQRVTPDGARLIGLALEEYVKNLVSKAIHAASHRNIQFKDDEHRIKVNDVKAQLKIIGEIMNREKLKAEEAEQDQRNKLIKSRPKKKDDDPEREKKKKDAKMKQEALQEREQQKRADLTALAATQRKRPNTGNKSSAGGGTTGSGGGNNANSTSGGPGGTTGPNRPQRVTRVKMRDLLFCLDSERLDRGSRDEVYKRYLK